MAELNTGKNLADIQKQLDKNAQKVTETAAKKMLDELAAQREKLATIKPAENDLERELGNTEEERVRRLKKQEEAAAEFLKTKKITVVPSGDATVKGNYKRRQSPFTPTSKNERVKSEKGESTSVPETADALNQLKLDRLEDIAARKKKIEAQMIAERQERAGFYKKTPAELALVEAQKKEAQQMQAALDEYYKKHKLQIAKETPAVEILPAKSFLIEEEDEVEPEPTAEISEPENYQLTKGEAEKNQIYFGLSEERAKLIKKMLAIRAGQASAFVSDNDIESLPKGFEKKEEAWAHMRPQISDFKPGSRLRRLYKRVDFQYSDRGELYKDEQDLQRARKKSQKDFRPIDFLAEDAEFAMMELLQNAVEELNGTMSICPASEFDDRCQKTDFIIAFDKSGAAADSNDFLYLAVDITVSVNRIGEKMTELVNRLKDAEIRQVRYFVNEQKDDDIGKREMLPMAFFLPPHEAIILRELVSIPAKDLTAVQKNELKQFTENFLEQVRQNLQDYQALVSLEIKNKNHTVKEIKKFEAINKKIQELQAHLEQNSNQ